MRKGIAEGRGSTTLLNAKELKKLESKGYKFVLVKGLTPDNHYEHVEPHCLILVPVKELPSDQGKKDIYAPIQSKILQQWAKEDSDSLKIFISGNTGN